MSLLMDALKQQQQVQVTADRPVAAYGWLKPVVLTGMMLAGLGLGFWLGRPAPVVIPVEAPAATPTLATPVVASAAEIAQELQLAAELLTPITAETQLDAASDQLVLSGERAQPMLGRSRADADFQSAEPFMEADPQQELSPVEELLPAAELENAEVPAELREKFETAQAAAERSNRQPRINYHDRPAVPVEQLDDVIQRQLPSLKFEAHVYATEPAQRWIKVNGKDLQQGQWLSADVQVKQILPQYVVLQFEQQTFSVEALSDWSYQRR